MYDKYFTSLFSFHEKTSLKLSLITHVDIYIYIYIYIQRYIYIYIYYMKGIPLIPVLSIGYYIIEIILSTILNGVN